MGVDLHAKGSAGPGDRLVWLAALCLMVAQGALLVRGYRVTADEAMFYQFGMRGPGSIFHETLLTAIDQGRVGAFVIIPINIVTAYLADSLAFRILYVLLFYAVFWLFAVWTGRLLGSGVVAAIFLLLVGLNVTDYLHFPPVSYPLQNTLPFLAIIGSRLLSMRMRDAADGRPGGWAEFGATLLFGLGLFASEYGILLGTAMLGCEIVAKAVDAGGPLKARLPLLIRRFGWDAAACLGVVATYVAWRLVFPSTYDGNQIGPVSRLPQALLTAGAHVFGPLGLPLASIPRPFPFPAPVWIAVAMAAGGIGAAGIYFARDQVARIRRPLIVAGLALLAAFYVVMPVSMTVKQQERCFERYGCAFLDSGIAFLAIAVMIAALAGAVLAAVAPWRRDRVALLLSALFGIGTGLAFHHNKRMTDDMAQMAGVWDRARIAVCGEGDLPLPLVDYFDPTRKLEMHAHIDREAFWVEYRDHYRPKCR